MGENPIQEEKKISSEGIRFYRGFLMCCLKCISFLILMVSMFLAKEITDDSKLMKIKGSDESNIDSKLVEAKIVGGQFAREGEFPHAALVAAHCDPENKNRYWICGASVLTQHILLTAGHCTEFCQTGFHMEVFAGSINYLHSKHVRNVSRYIIHSQYNSFTMVNDIALILLWSSLPLSSKVKRVIIRPHFPDNTEGQLAGWGYTNEAGKSTIRLRKVSQTVRPADYCTSRYMPKHVGIMCASNGKEMKYPYKGDSGSGLIINNHQVVGLVSYRNEPYRDIIIYTNVSYYYHWIVSKSKSLYCFKHLK